jgi:hypothetical protein
VRCDGRKGDIGTGPVSKDGELTAHFYVRDKGAVVHSITVESRVYGNELVLNVAGPDGAIIHQHKTQR